MATRAIVHPAKAGSPFATDPLDEFARESSPVPTQPPAATVLLRPVPVVSRPRQISRVAAAGLALVQLPLVALWLWGVPSPLKPVVPVDAVSPAPPLGAATVPTPFVVVQPSERHALEGVSLLIETRPARARVWVDGVDQGQSPVAMESVRPGLHTVVARFASEAVAHTIDIRPGQAQAVVIAGPPGDVVPSGRLVDLPLAPAFVGLDRN